MCFIKHALINGVQLIRHALHVELAFKYDLIMFLLK